MKRALVLSLICVLGLGALAFAGPVLSPFVELVTDWTGTTAIPSFEAGAVLVADLADEYTMELGFTLADENILAVERERDLSLEAGIFYNETLEFESGKWLVVGAAFSFDHSAICTLPTLLTTNRFLLSDQETYIEALGRVGPLELWVGCTLPWINTGVVIEPQIGLRIAWDWLLAKPVEI